MDGFPRHAHERGMDKGGAHGRGNVRVATEALARREGNEHRHEVERGVSTVVEERVLDVVGAYKAKRLDRVENALQKATADDGGDERGKDAGEGVEEKIGEMFGREIARP